MFVAALFTIAEMGKQRKCPLTDEWINKGGQSMQWNMIQAKIKGKKY